VLRLHAYLGDIRQEFPGSSKIFDNWWKITYNEVSQTSEVFTMELEEVRERIDRIDYEIIKLLNERIELGLRTRKLKPAVEDKEREKQVIENIEKIPLKLVRKEFSKQLFNNIIAETKQKQLENPMLVGFKGEHGASGDVAIHSYDPRMIPIPCVHFSDVVEGIKKGIFNLGIIPVENSLEGGVNEVNDLLIEENLYICGEIKQRLGYALLTLPETDYRVIKEVYSHPQALAECSGFISRNHLEGRPYYDAAGAARLIAESRLRASAAIASTLCAELYNLQIIKEDIEDDTSTYTRFILVGKEKCKEKGNKCSILFSSQNQFGELYGILKIFSEAKINLIRVASHPSRQEQGNWVFLLDFIGSDRDEKISALLEQVEKRAVDYKLLGCYRAAE
jgi:prephenate dehydratase/chorismate mutase